MPLIGNCGFCSEAPWATPYPSPLPPGKPWVFRPDPPDQDCCLARGRGTVGRKGGNPLGLQPFIKLAAPSPEARTSALSCHSDPLFVWRIKDGAGRRQECSLMPNSSSARKPEPRAEVPPQHQPLTSLGHVPFQTPSSPMF